MLLTKEVEITINPKTFKHYKDLGYDFQYVGDKIIVEVQDLTSGSKAIVDVQCDYCGNIVQIGYGRYISSIKNNNKNACSNCIQHKTSETIMKKYGTDNYSKTSEFREKFKNVCLEKYGVENVSQVEEFKNKRIETCLKKYGVENPFQVEEFKEKLKETNLEKYGCEYPQQSLEIRKKTMSTVQEKYGVNHISQSKDIRKKTEETNLARYGEKSCMKNSEIIEKIKNTCLERYGVDHPNKCSEIASKIRTTYYKNNTTPTSIQQLFLHELYGGELNFPISRYSADICIQEENLVIEYDGGGHNLQVKLGRLTQEEFNQKEIVRNQVIKHEGYKIMTIISSKDLLPSDEILLQMLEQSKEYFNSTDHTWIEYDIDAFLMRNAINKEGVFFDYGELRQIRKAS